MFNKKDYLSYFKQLYEIEIVMKKETEQLLKLVADKESKKIIARIRADEIRHAKIVREMIKLIN